MKYWLFLLLLTAALAFAGDSLNDDLLRQYKPRKPGAQKKARRIVVPHLRVEDVELRRLLRFLEVKSRELDPQGEGVNFFYKVPREKLTAKVSLDVDDIPMSELLRYVAMTTAYEVVYEKHAIVIQRDSK